MKIIKQIHPKIRSRLPSLLMAAVLLSLNTLSAFAQAGGGSTTDHESARTLPRRSLALAKRIRTRKVQPNASAHCCHQITNLRIMRACQVGHLYRSPFPAGCCREKPLIPRARRLRVTDITERLRRLAMMGSMSVPSSEPFHGCLVGDGSDRMPKEILRAWMPLGVRRMIRTRSDVEYFVSNSSSSGIQGSDFVAFGNRPVLR
jgi:hypothetical protein